MEKTKSCIDDYKLEYWIGTLGSIPVKEIAHGDYSQSYEMDRMMVYELENGKYATILEVGCSCYDSADAQIDLFPTKKAAMTSFEAYEKDRKSMGY